MEGFMFVLLCLAVFLVCNWKLLVRNKKTVIAYVLWLLLGGLGIHAFYCKKTNCGLFTLLFWLLGVCLFLVDGGTVLMLNGINVLIQAFLIPTWIKQQKEKGVG